MKQVLIRYSLMQQFLTWLMSRVEFLVLQVVVYEQ